MRNLTNKIPHQHFIVAMTGITQPQTLKVFGYIKKTKVMVLIDSGSSHNFIDTMIDKDN
jgi:hypothetical protein